MKTEKELNDDILKITMTIQEKFPELSKYISEMPETMPGPSSPEVTIKNLTDYYNSLDVLLKKHAANHSNATV